MIPHPRHAARYLGCKHLLRNILQRIADFKKLTKISDLGDIISKNISMDKTYSYCLCNSIYSLSLMSSQERHRPS